MREHLSDGVIMIRRYGLDAADDLYDAARESTGEIFPWLPWCRPDFQRQDGLDWITSEIRAWDAGTCFEFVIRTVAGTHLGGGGINGLHADQPIANLGYWIRSSQTRKGYATRATRLLAEFGFNDLRLQRVEIVAAVGNIGSQKVAEKAGAQREGILRNRLRLHSQNHDAVMFSLIP